MEQPQETSFGDLPKREILGLNEALKRTRGAMVDNLAKLSQLDTDITQAEQELGGEEAANDPEKKRRIQELLNRLRTSGHLVWRRLQQTVRPFAHSSLASGRQSSGYSTKTRRWQSAFVHYSVSRGYYRVDPHSIGVHRVDHCAGLSKHTRRGWAHASTNTPRP